MNEHLRQDENSLFPSFEDYMLVSMLKMYFKNENKIYLKNYAKSCEQHELMRFFVLLKHHFPHVCVTFFLISYADTLLHLRFISRQFSGIFK